MSNMADFAQAGTSKTETHDNIRDNLERDAALVYETPTFNTKTIQELLKMRFRDKNKTKINSDAVRLSCELFRLLAHEGALRAVKQAKIQGEEEVTLEHLEKILPQLLLDFP
ncbi:centromere protein X-like [Ornithodoros turicata]|uniref:centromere protein X-like n=1 Tax=Ornithodoros turicata TaxID=34597 RepID=UPI00313905F5